MNKNVLLAVPGMALLLASGCIIRHEEQSVGPYDSPSASEARSCARHEDCHAGCFCDPAARRCRSSDICTKDDSKPLWWTKTVIYWS